MKHLGGIVLAIILGAVLVLGIVYRKQIEVIWGDATRYLERVNDEATPQDSSVIEK